MVWISTCPGKLPAPGAAGHLREQLKRSLGCAKIRHPETDIGGDHSHQRHVRNVVAFGDHLRADENVEFALAKAGRMVSYAACR